MSQCMNRLTLGARLRSPCLPLSARNSQNMEYRPADFLDENSDPSKPQPALIILNQPIASFNVFRRLWYCSKYRLCADGGANRLFDLLSESHRAEFVCYGCSRILSHLLISEQLPHLIHGDLDSLRADVREYYASKGVVVSQDTDQYTTDFGKAMHKILGLQDHLSSPLDVLVLGSLAGRVDQGLGFLHEMFREQGAHENLKIWLFSERSISFTLEKGSCTIHTPLSTGRITRNVGIIPVYGASKISTSGLEWDVESWPTSMGTQVSTSNHIVSSTITVQADATVLFTVELDDAGM